MARPLRGGGVRAWPLKKIAFFEALKKIPPKNAATKLLKNNFFWRGACLKILDYHFHATRAHLYLITI